jgi:hypothetical protein
MGNCASTRNRRERNSNAGQEGREFDNLSQQANRPRSPQTGTTSNFPASNLPQTQASLENENAPREVNGADFNQYMTVESIKGEPKEMTTGQHDVGHNFLVKVNVRNRTTESLRFTSTPSIEWKEIIRKTDGENAQTTTEELDQYERLPTSQTFYFWRTAFEGMIAPNEQKEIMILDRPKLGIPQDKDNNVGRTCSRKVDFDIGLPESEKRLKATQNIEVVNGQTMVNDFQIH